MVFKTGAELQYNTANKNQRVKKKQNEKGKDEGVVRGITNTVSQMGKEKTEHY